MSNDLAKVQRSFNALVRDILWFLDHSNLPAHCGYMMREECQAGKKEVCYTIYHDREKFIKSFTFRFNPEDLITAEESYENAWYTRRELESLIKQIAS